MNRFTFNWAIVLILSVLSLSATSFAQENNAVVAYDLDACLQYAMQNETSIKNASLSRSSAEGRINQTLADGLPQVNGSFSITDNLAIQTVFLPAAFFGGGADEPSVPVRFGVPVTGSAGITVRQLIFDGSFFLGLKASKTYRELSETSSEATKVEVIEKVSKAYYAVLVNQERLSLIQVNLARLDTVLRQTQAMYDNGFSEKIDVDRVKINHNNTSYEKKLIERELGMSKILLKYQMGMSVKENIEVVGDLKQIIVEEVQFESDENFDYNRRSEYRNLQTQLTLSELNVKSYQVLYMPDLYFSGALGWNAGVETVGDVFSFNKNTWFKYANIGITLSVPVFDGFRKRSQIQQARYSMQQLENDIIKAENTITVEQIQARSSLLSSWEYLLAQKENMDLSSSIYQTVRVKFQEGIGTSLELVEAETAYKEAENKYYAAMYAALVSRVDYQKSLGNLK